MSDHFPTKAEQDAFFAQWHAQQQLTTGSDILQPRPVSIGCSGACEGTGDCDCSHRDAPRVPCKTSGGCHGRR